MDDTYWGLTGRPFQLTPDPRFWFETATHRKAMAYLGYGLAQGEGFIVITGDIGAGKTTLVGHLLDTVDRQRLSPLKIVSTAIEADDLLRIVAGQLDVEAPGATKAQLLVAIERGLHAVARSGRRTLLIVDEAQALPVSALEELRMLSNFQAGGHALLQIVLLGQPEFRDRLHGSDRLEQLRQRVIAIHHLDPMEEHEVADYIAHRLQVVGWQGRPDFAADAFDAFYRGSAGVPRRLNLLAGRVMLHAAIERLDLIDARTVRNVLRDLHADLPIMALEPMSDEEAATAPLPIVRDGVLPFVPSDSEEQGISAPQGVSSPTLLAFEPDSPSAETAPPIADGWFRPATVPTPVLVDAAVAPAPLLDPESFGDARDDLDREAAPQEPRPVASAEPWTPEQAIAEPEGDASHDEAEADLAARITRLEHRVEEQDEALRRVLTLLVDWIEADERPAPAPVVTQPVPIRGATTWTDAA